MTNGIQIHLLSFVLSLQQDKIENLKNIKNENRNQKNSK
jgi:hypothetical protein